MTTSAAIVVVVSVGAITYVMRVGMIAVLAGRVVHRLVERSLRHVGPAVLTALAVQLAFDGSVDGASVGAGAVTGMVVAGIVGWWRRNLLLATTAGMLTVWAVAAVG